MDFRIEKRFIADWTEFRIKRIATGISSDRPFSGLIVAPVLAIFMMALPAVWSGEALAQDVPEAGQIEERFEEPVEPRATFEQVVPETERQLPPEEAEKIKFELSGLIFEGVTVYESSEFLPFYEEYLSQEVSLADIYEIAGKVSNLYLADGFILSFAIVPAQTVRGGIIRIQVIEGFVSEIFVEGPAANSIFADPSGQARHDLVIAYAKKIVSEGPLRLSDLEKYLLLAGDLPGVTANGVLSPSQNIPGASDLVVVVDFDRANGFMSADNRGTRFVGPYQLGTGLNINSVAGLYEQVGVRLIGTSEYRELRLGSVTYQHQLGTEGTKLYLSAGRTFSEPGFTLEDLDIKSFTTTFGVSISHPWIRSRSENLSTTFEFDFRNTKTDSFKAPLSEDRLRVFRIGGVYDFVDSLRGINLIALKYSQGVDFMHAKISGSDLLSRENGHSDFGAVRADLSRLQSILPGLTLLGEATGQYSFSQLLASEEFGLGGERYGRAYDPYEISADHGVAAKLELQYGISDDGSIFKGIQIYGYYEFGAVWHRLKPAVSSTGASGKSRESLASTGLGIRFNLTDYISGYVEATKPLTQPVSARGASGDEWRPFFSIAQRF
jgi:hemolysin activation/secretion protein